jgi:ssDNA-binding Zn-finger/Zn-ribbon topoisomerase 1
LSVPKTGFAKGSCPKCGKLLVRKRPADLAVCDCYKYCPLCGAEMTPFNPDLTPSTYRGEESYAVKGQAVLFHEWTVETLYVCHNHTPPYYSCQKPVEVKLS